jgi:hypothetical protein
MCIEAPIEGAYKEKDVLGQKESRFQNAPPSAAISRSTLHQTNT